MGQELQIDLIIQYVPKFDYEKEKYVCFAVRIGKVHS